MSAEQYANAAATTLANSGGITSGSTSFVVTSGTGFPSSGPFRILIGSELLTVGARSGATFSSVTRGVESTSAASHSDGDAVTHVLTAASLLAVLERQARGPGYSDPTTPSYAWTNQGGASVTSLTDGGVFLSVPAAAGNSWRIRRIAAPSTPYTITALMRPLHNPFSTGAPGWALGFRESSSGKLHLMRFQFNGSTDLLTSLHIDKWTDEATFSANYASVTAMDYAAGAYLRIADDATNRICSLSLDGVNFVTAHTIGRTDFLTADQVLFAANANDGSNAAGVTLLSWAQG